MGEQDNTLGDESEGSPADSNRGVSPDESTASFFSDDAFYHALAAQRRRQILGYLLEHDESTVDELVEVLCGWEATADAMVSAERYSQLQTAVVHNHLPCLVEAGLVRHDRDAGTVTLCELDRPVQAVIEWSLDGEQR